MTYVVLLSSGFSPLTLRMVPRVKVRRQKVNPRPKIGTHSYT